MNRYRWRFVLLFLILSLAFAGILWRLIDLGVIKRTFLLRQSEARILRAVKIPAYRGMITDRLGKPLAISTAVDSIWANPKIFEATPEQLKQLANLLNTTPEALQHQIEGNKRRGFIYLQRRLSPEIASQIKALKIQGIFSEREYRRFYPEGEVTAHVVGLTNIDDQGQEGLELAYNSWLAGQPGKKEVLKDRMGHIISDIRLMKAPQQGHDLQLSLDHRIQYLAFEKLKAALSELDAESGSIVVLDVRTGEVLAMVNLPTYNPNNRPKIDDGVFKNRAVTDLFEPGSTIKPFNIAMALESGQYLPETTIDTNPGWMKISGYRISDEGLNHGVINLTQVLQKSSNIGAAKIMLSLQPQQYWKLLHAVGFGDRTGSGFPGESPGTLVRRDTWQPSVVATLAYGYGIAVTVLQLAQSYAVLANEGLKIPVSFVKTSDAPSGVRVIRSDVAKEVNGMLETVVGTGGTGRRAAVDNYRVAGKTGTAYIATNAGYDRHRYIASFAGFAPASDPKIVIVVVVREPKKKHLGGLVAAPLFADVMAGSLRILNIMPDRLSQ